MTERRSRQQRIYARCPDVRIGDVWHDVWDWDDPITITAFKPQKDLPWPLVATNKGIVGLPAFIFGEREKQGRGKSWRTTADETPPSRKASSGGQKRARRVAR